ncbi:MAG: hypothetical protein SPH82_13285 [Eubacteriales bacterium]|nr:hypothetical protein [Eubacteriales bacterium]
MNRIDFDRAFPQTPDCVGEAIRLGFLRGARTAARRRRVAGMLSVAAALVILLGAALFSMGRMNQPRADLLPLSRPNCSPTPVPTATITAEPTATATPAPTVGASDVYCTQGGHYYHSAPDCSGMEGATHMTIEKAEAMGKTACPSCIGSVVYCTQSGYYYHSEADCSGMQGASPTTIERAEVMGKKPCRLCMEYSAFCTSGGTYYHSESDCSGMQGASPTTLAAAISLGKAPCPDCFLPAALNSTVYASNNAPGGYYHSLPGCGGQSFGRALTMEQALAEGYGACPDCAWNPLTLYESATVTEASSWDNRVYYTPGGMYYHLAEDCSGMQNASAHSISTANADGKKPCPACFGESVSWVQLTDGALTVYSSSEEINAEISINNR